MHQQVKKKKQNKNRNTHTQTNKHIQHTNIGQHCFELKDTKTMILRAEKEEDMHRWLNALLRAKLLTDESVDLRFAKGELDFKVNERK